MMKKLIAALLSVVCLQGVQAQEDEPISARHEGYIFKPAKVEASESRVQNLKLPEGFSINVFASDLGAPRMMVLKDSSKIYVSNRDDGLIYLLTDDNADGEMDTKQVVVRKEHAHGMAIHQDNFYFITVNELYRAPIRQDGTLGKEEMLIEDLPDGGQHANRTIFIGPDEKLYITVGSTCNACDEPNPENATIVVADLDGNNRKVFAEGLRNTIGIDWHPETGELYGMDHGIDWLGNTEQKEELNKLEEGNHYGWPYIYADGKKNLADEPEEGYAAFREKATDPLLLLTAHSAPMNFHFYTGDQFPEEYRNSAFVTLHGSWNREEAVGYKVVRIPFEGSQPGEPEDFLSGFLTDDGKAQFGRVVGLLQMPDGSLLVSDDANGMIYRVSYD
jgi:glucose/arabinose dehydrogenase